VQCIDGSVYGLVKVKSGDLGIHTIEASRIMALVLPLLPSKEKKQ
jgi:hypothetical protein